MRPTSTPRETAAGASSSTSPLLCWGPSSAASGSRPARPLTGPGPGTAIVPAPSRSINSCAPLMLTGWGRQRRVIVLRRRILDERLLAEKKRLADTTPDQQLALGFVEIVKDGPLYEYAVLVTSLPDEILSLGQHYRDRADAENNFDELKNQWGWSGFTTHDLKRCQIMARTIALI